MLPIGDVTTQDYYITRPNGRDDGGTVRVMFAIFSTHINWMLCYAVASAYFTNIPVVVIGYKTHKYHHIARHNKWLEAAVKIAQLNEHDLLLKLDADIMFTGADFLPFIDKFIKLSPVNLTELDAKAIRTGEAMAPVLYGTETGSFSPQSISENELYVHETYLWMEFIHHSYETTINNDIKPFFNYHNNSFEHLNGGTSIQRVWAMKELFMGATRFMELNKPINKKRQWSCDQSVFTKLYLELRLWEIKEDYFHKSSESLRQRTNEYGLHAGLLGLDLQNQMSATVHRDSQIDFYISNQLWVANASHNMSTTKLHDPALYSVLRELYMHFSKTALFTQRNLTRSYSNVHSVTIAPPLLSIVPRHINGKDKPAERVYPPIVHFAAHPKEQRYEWAISCMQWYLPMMFNEEDWKRGKQYVMSMPIELWTDKNDKLRLRYGDVCTKHPFYKNT